MPPRHGTHRFRPAPALFDDAGFISRAPPPPVSRPSKHLEAPNRLRDTHHYTHNPGCKPPPRRAAQTPRSDHRAKGGGGTALTLLRGSLDFVSYKYRKLVAAALKDIYRAIDAAAADAALSGFEAGVWGQKYPAIGMAWRRVWTEVIPFFAFPKDVRRLIYTTNAIEALNSKLRRAVRARGHFPTDEAALKLLYLVLNRTEKEWTMPPREWSMAKAQMAVLFGERFTRAAA
jgi:hypothetical protein